MQDHTNTITIVGMWESTIIEPNVERFMLMQLRGAYDFGKIIMVPPLVEMDGISTIIQCETMEEALEYAKGIRVFLEPNGPDRIQDVPEGDIVFITGNASISNMKHVRSEDYCVGIPTVHNTDLFTVNALAIALDRRLFHEHR